MPTKPADRTSSVARTPSDFESQLQALVFEAAPLRLVSAPVAGPGSAERPGAHGPWDPQRCATVLLRWLDADLVVLLESTAAMDGALVVTESRQLAYDQARTMLSDPGTWSLPTPTAGEVHLMYSGERALEVDDDVWWSTARAGDHQAQTGAAQG